MARSSMTKIQRREMTKEWHAPGIGEIHSKDHRLTIFCYRYDSTEPYEIIDDELAKYVCKAINEYRLKEPRHD